MNTDKAQMNTDKAQMNRDEDIASGNFLKYQSSVLICALSVFICDPNYTRDR